MPQKTSPPSHRKPQLRSPEDEQFNVALELWLRALGITKFDLAEQLKELRDLAGVPLGSHNTVDRACTPLKNQRPGTTLRLRNAVKDAISSFNVERRNAAAITTLERFYAGPEPVETESSWAAYPTLPAATRHLFGYLDTLVEGRSTAQLQHNRVRELELFDATAMTLETLQAWDEAALKLGHVADLHLEMGDPVCAARALLRQGIAFHRSERFDLARRALVRALWLVRRLTPRGSAMRTELELWLQLGLLKLRPHGKRKQPRASQAKWMFQEPCTRLLNRFATHVSPSLSCGRSNPLCDQMVPLLFAKRDVRLGVALKDLGNFAAARDCLVSGLDVRLTYGAHSEVARGLRHLGLIHAERGRFLHAIYIYQLCMNWQAALKDRREQARTHFYRAEAFHIMHQRHPSRSCGNDLRLLNSSMFDLPDQMPERSLLEKISRVFRGDDQVPDKEEHYHTAALFNYELAIEKGRATGLHRLVATAEEGLRRLHLLPRQKPEETIFIARPPVVNR